MVIGLYALQELRKGNTDMGLQLIEQHTFSGAIHALQIERGFSKVSRELVEQLIQYRKQFNTNEVKWSATERRLDGLLHRPSADK